MLFPLGKTVATPGAIDAMTQTSTGPRRLLQRHLNGDWGEALCDEDKELNDQSVKNGSRILSAYYLPDKTKIWIITEAADENGHRLATTFLLPSEY